MPVRRVSVSLNVANWRYGRQHYLHTDTNTYEVRRTLTLTCYRDGRTDLYINGRQFLAAVEVQVCPADPFVLGTPLLIDQFSARSEVRQILGKLSHFPEMVGEDSMGEFIGGDLRVPDSVFAEMFACRDGIRFLNLDLSANNYDTVNFEDANWRYSNTEENSLFILGFTYAIASSDEAKDGSN